MRSIDREILRLGVPALGALAIEPLYVLVDTAIVGRLGTDQLAGVAIAGVVLTAVFALFNFLAYATTGTVARFIGAGQRGDAAAQGVDALWLAAVLGTVLAIVGLVFAEPIVSFMGASESVTPFALTYLRISLLGAPAMLLGLAGIGYLRGCQDTKTPLVVALTANVANLVIEIVLVYGLDLGVAGSAWSTVIAQVGAAIAFVGIVIAAVRRHHVSLRPDAQGIRASARVGGHLVVRTASLLAGFLTATAVAARISDAAVAAHQIAFQIWLFTALTLDAIAIAAQAILAKDLGAGNPVAARTASGRMVQWGLMMGGALALVILVLRPWLSSAFTADPAVQSLVSDVLVIVAVTMPLNAVVFVLDGVLIGAGETRYLAVAMLGAYAVYLPAALIVLTSGAGLVALWLALSWFMVARAIGMGVRYRTDAWLVTGARRT